MLHTRLNLSAVWQPLRLTSTNIYNWFAKNSRRFGYAENNVSLLQHKTSTNFYNAATTKCQDSHPGIFTATQVNAANNNSQLTLAYSTETLSPLKKLSPRSSKAYSNLTPKSRFLLNIMCILCQGLRGKITSCPKRVVIHFPIIARFTLLKKICSMILHRITLHQKKLGPAEIAVPC